MYQPKTVYKARDLLVTQEYLTRKANYSLTMGFEKQKWIIFCEYFLKRGFEIYLYEAKETYSKYVTVKKEDKQVKVRFSNHKPIKSREANGDCDFFVGVSNFSITTTDDAIKFVEEFFS